MGTMRYEWCLAPREPNRSALVWGWLYQVVEINHLNINSDGISDRPDSLFTKKYGI